MLKTCLCGICLILVRWVFIFHTVVTVLNSPSQSKSNSPKKTHSLFASFTGSDTAVCNKLYLKAIAICISDSYLYISPPKVYIRRACHIRVYQRFAANGKFKYSGTLINEGTSQFLQFMVMIKNVHRVTVQKSLTIH